MLTPAIHTFRGNRRTLGLLVSLLVADAIAFWAVLKYKPSDSSLYLLGINAAFLVLGFCLYWVLSLRVHLYPDGISTQTFLGHKEIRWDNVDRFYYSCMKHYVHGIPTGTHYTFTLFDRQGVRIMLGDAVESPEQFDDKLIQFTQRPLISRAIEQYNSGVEASFGPVTISRTGGVRIKFLLYKKQIPIHDIGRYDMHRGNSTSGAGDKSRRLDFPLACPFA